MATLVRVRTTAMTSLRLNREAFRFKVSLRIPNDDSQENYTQQKTTNKRDTAKSQHFTAFVLLYLIRTFR
jgi:hypothetical protein